MADQKQLEILKQGVEVWNKWRAENKLVKVDLTHANLYNTNLSEINFNNADLFKANLSNTNLSNASLSNASLYRTRLAYANLSYTNLTNARILDADFLEANLANSNLSNADIFNTDLSYSNLNFANLSFSRLDNSNLSFADLNKTKFISVNLIQVKFIGSYLSNSNLDSCILNTTVFSLTNLSTVRGLETVKVYGECAIDFQTLRDSKNIPKEFLLKIGLPENYINYLPDFYDESPIRLFPVFLSHSWANKEFAGKLYEALIKKGVLVWYDEKKLRAGDKIFEGLTKAIDVYDKMILVCSKESLEESWWVDEEMNRIFKKERTYLKEKKKNVSLLIPITIDDHIFKWKGAKGESIRDKVIGDFSEWKDDVKFEKALNELIEALNVDRREDNITSFI